MSDTSSTRRWLALAAFVTFVLSIAFLEQRVLPGVVDARSSLDELAYWQHHVERNGETAASHLRLGIAFERADRLDEAEDSYAAALALDSGYDAAAIGRYGVGAAKGDQATSATWLVPGGGRSR